MIADRHFEMRRVAQHAKSHMRISFGLLSPLISRHSVTMPGCRCRLTAQPEITGKRERRGDVWWRLGVEPGDHPLADQSSSPRRAVALSATYMCSVTTAIMSMGSLSTLSLVRCTGEPFFV